MSKIWVDAQTGTWGRVENVYILDDPGTTSEGHIFDLMADSDIGPFAMMQGIRLNAILERDEE